MAICPQCGGMMEFDDHIDTTDVPTKLYQCLDCGAWEYFAADGSERHEQHAYATVPLFDFDEIDGVVYTDNRMGISVNVADATIWERGYDGQHRLNSRESAWVDSAGNVMAVMPQVHLWAAYVQATMLHQGFGRTVQITPLSLE